MVSLTHVGTISKVKSSGTVLEARLRPRCRVRLLGKPRFVFLSHSGTMVPYLLGSVSVYPSFLKLSLSNVSLSEVYALRGLQVFLPAKEVKLEEEGEPIVGYGVVDLHAGHLGEVVSVSGSSEQPLMRVRGSHELLVPYAGGLVTSVDHAHRVVYVDLPTGFVEAFSASLK